MRQKSEGGKPMTRIRDLARMKSAAGITGFLLLVGCVVTAFSVLAAVGLVIALTLPMSLFALLMSPIVLQAFWLALLLASPTTLVILPAAAGLMRQHPFGAILVLPLLGFANGGLTLFVADRIWNPSPGSSSGEILIFVAMLLGLASGCLFSRALFELRA